MDMPSVFTAFTDMSYRKINCRALVAGFCLGAFVILASPFTGTAAWALDKVNAEVPEARTVIRGSGLPVPRFVSLKSNVVNMRVGPGHEYPLQWVYVRKNLPLKVISEFDVWRKVVDHEGVTGWVHGQLVSLKRYGVITSSNAKLRAEPSPEADVTAVAEAGVLMEVQYCEGQWCRLGSDIARGWLERSRFWGVLPGEALN